MARLSGGRGRESINGVSGRDCSCQPEPLADGRSKPRASTSGRTPLVLAGLPPLHGLGTERLAQRPLHGRARAYTRLECYTPLAGHLENQNRQVVPARIRVVGSACLLKDPQISQDTGED